MHLPVVDRYRPDILFPNYGTYKALNSLALCYAGYVCATPCYAVATGYVAGLAESLTLIKIVEIF